MAGSGRAAEVETEARVLERHPQPRDIAGQSLCGVPLELV